MVETSRTERVLGPLRVGLRSDLHVTRQETRGGVRYVVHDPVSFQNHAFRPADYRILTTIVRHRSLAETFRRLVDDEVLEDSADDRQGFYKFVLWLHGVGILHLPITGGSVAFERMQQKQAARRGPWYGLLMSHRIPIWNPDRFLSRTVKFTGWLFGPPGVALWLALMALCAWKCADRVGELFAATSGLFALGNLPSLWIALVGLKVLHEFGHAYASKRFGAAVPEMGVQMIMLTPCAYVDAGASWKLPSARHRVAVGLAGMYVESFVAGVAALVWAGTAEGFWHDFAFNVVALASIVTVLFNVNPLMKYDGYFLFSDLLGVFNLQQRAAAFLNGWAARVLLGKPRPRDRYARSERLLYGLYGPLAFCYRALLAFGLTAMMAMHWPAAGLFLGAVFAWALLVRPVLGLLVYLWSDPSTQPHRGRSRLLALSLVTLVPLLGGLLPISWSIVAPGILDPQSRESVRAPVGAFVASVDVANGAEVEAGATLCRLRNPEIEMRRLRLLGELTAEIEGLDAIELEDPTEAAIHRARISYLRASVEEHDRRLASMQLTAASAGTVADPTMTELEGRFLQQGEELFQIQSGHRYLRIVLTEQDLSRTRLEIGSPAEVRWTCDPGRPVAAVVREIRAAASRFELPTALTMLGGGDVYVRPTTGALVAADQPYLHVLLEVESVPLAARGTGLTAKVQLPARVQMLGAWLQHRVLAFLNAWRMS